MKILKIRKKKVVPDLIFFTAQRSENISFIFSLVKTSEDITFSKYAFYFINNSLYFITLYIINNVALTSNDVASELMRLYITLFARWDVLPCSGGKMSPRTSVV